jgi:hypothetical protein
MAAAAQHHRLTMAAYVGNQLDAFGRAHKHSAIAFLAQGVEVADVGHSERVADIARSSLKELCLLAVEQRLVEVGGHRQLRLAAGENVALHAQVGHDPQIPKKDV